MPVEVSLGLVRPVGERVADMARQAVRGRTGAADALVLPCTDPPAYDVIPQPEAEPRIPVISANQVTRWAALRRLGTRAMGPNQALIDASARSGTVLPGQAPTVPPGQTTGPVPPDAPGEKQQEGWT
ncbi:decarboxylase [Streptomyces sp. NPDC102359]|uniref:decarboxylase n=1 Tax=unclassified Streptomyces TaxID=2593676 RepID=UPI0037FC4D66